MPAGSTGDPGSSTLYEAQLLLLITTLYVQVKLLGRLSSDQHQHIKERVTSVLDKSSPPRRGVLDK